MAGIALLSATTVLYGLIPGYPALFALSIVAGAANSVFHPADYSILNASVTKARLGRAFSVHNLGGFVGYAAAPVLMSGMGAFWGLEDRRYRGRRCRIDHGHHSNRFSVAIFGIPHIADATRPDGRDSKLT